MGVEKKAKQPFQSYYSWATTTVTTHRDLQSNSWKLVWTNRGWLLFLIEFEGTESMLDAYEANVPFWSIR
jgi:hypothetical protein